MSARRSYVFIGGIPLLTLSGTVTHQPSARMSSLSTLQLALSLLVVFFLTPQGDLWNVNQCGWHQEIIKNELSRIKFKLKIEFFGQTCFVVSWGIGCDGIIPILSGAAAKLVGDLKLCISVDTAAASICAWLSMINICVSPPNPTEAFGPDGSHFLFWGGWRAGLFTIWIYHQDNEISQ